MVLFLNYGVDIETQNERGLTPFTQACERGQFSCIKLLLSHGANINKQNGQMTSLMLAMRMNNGELVRLLLKHGADIHSKDEMGLTALHHGASKGSFIAVEMVLEKG